MLVGKFAMNLGFLFVISITFTLLNGEDLDSVSFFALVVDTFEDLCTTTVTEFSDQFDFFHHTF